jgi:hypothetical protein
MTEPKYEDPAEEPKVPSIIPPETTLDQITKELKFEGTKQNAFAEGEASVIVKKGEEEDSPENMKKSSPPSNLFSASKYFLYII